MIVVDTSALVAMLANELHASACEIVFQSENRVLISAGTMLEALIVATRRGFDKQMRELLTSPAIEVIEVTSERSQLAADAYLRWGKGIHPAALNYGDCFAYATAKEFGCPLLFVGNDFSQTDIQPAIPNLM
ncbi:type II toxin-antitoxin system VapC family toxin [Rhizobium sp. P40RR-XXII]|uniref:type II toxin-antitoxin system VapC family toxin n=1 Tax=unclassified Rhizobium TaxID=2613769 RepID=UPI001456A0AF|nr:MULTISPECIES: type II toxin-antitoxin system VapC family toxin [unclassified Rhizobium]NLR84278.1 type II toxin-antitoxin system VapC family toxin [Rhizobium sp. P28RR-XV]NLS15076.1 type II toxin-antitoxin system VapC family toxin [Rhizobium sp. P40RR-XXII]